MRGALWPPLLTAAVPAPGCAPLPSGSPRPGFCGSRELLLVLHTPPAAGSAAGLPAAVRATSILCTDLQHQDMLLAFPLAVSPYSLSSSLANLRLFGQLAARWQRPQFSLPQEDHAHLSNEGLSACNAVVCQAHIVAFCWGDECCREGTERVSAGVSLCPADCLRVHNRDHMSSMSLRSPCVLRCSCLQTRAATEPWAVSSCKDCHTIPGAVHDMTCMGRASS